LDERNVEEARKLADSIQVDHTKLFLQHEKKTDIYDKCYNCLKANISRVEKRIKEKGSATENSDQHLVEIRSLSACVDKRFIKDHSKVVSKSLESCLER
jgi:hypothetical protein